VGVVEQRPADWINALAEAIDAMPELGSHVPEAVGLCGQTPTVVPVDEHGLPTRNALTWQDGRASREAVELAERFGDPLTLIGTELPWSASNMPAKLLWLSRHEPELRRETRFILQPKDFIGMTLTGSPLSDAWSSKGLCRVTDGAPAAAVLDACGWNADVCPSTAAPWEPRGTITATAAQRFGLKVGTPVSVGASDAIAQMIASGSFARRSAFFFSGTSSIVGTTVVNESVRVPGLFSVPATCVPSRVIYGPTQSGGAALAWSAKLLGIDVDDLFALAASSGPSWPIFVPYLSGERAPLWNLDVRALFVGVDEQHGRAEIAMAAVVGTFLSPRDVLALIEETAHEPLNEIEVVGRGVNNHDWESIAMRTLGLPLRFHTDPDMSARGSAMLALALSGTTVDEASRQLSDESRLVHPETRDVDTARDLLARYRRASQLALQWLEPEPA
jgi:xylulokinase